PWEGACPVTRLDLRSPYFQNLMKPTKNEGNSPSNNEFRLRTWRNARFAVLGNKLTRSLEDLYRKEFDLSQTAWRIIATLAENAPMSAKDLAELIAIDSITITRATSDLVKRGLLIRRINKQDRRKIELRLSARGRKVYDRIVPVALEIEQTVFSVLTENEGDQLDFLLSKIEGHIDKVLTRDRVWGSFRAKAKP
ncbi:MarR family winged helix-turn-helix transcriptional regulator, partial [Neopusillimonas maritima]